MNSLLLDPAVTEQGVNAKAAAVADAQSALQQAQEQLAAAEQQHKMALSFADIIRDADSKVLALISQYRKEQQARLLNDMGDDPTSWQPFDPSKFRAQPIHEWLESRTVIDSAYLNKLFDRFKSEASDALPPELHGEGKLSAFAELVIRRLYVDDNWPRLSIVDNGGYLIKDVSIKFDKSDMR